MAINNVQKQLSFSIEIMETSAYFGQAIWSTLELAVHQQHYGSACRLPACWCACSPTGFMLRWLPLLCT